MSRLIDTMRASGFGHRSVRDLTLDYGEWLEKNQRDDVFTANPDFAQEYHVIKDEIARARRPSFAEEFKGSFGSAVDDLQASGFALGALAAEGARGIIPGAESAREKFLELMREQEAEAAEFTPSVPSYRDISGDHVVEDTARYVTHGLGTLAPSIIQSGAAALVGAAGGAAAGSAAAPGPGTAMGTIGGAIFGLAERRLAQKALSAVMERGARNVTLEQVAKALPREAVEAEAKRLAIQYGGQLGMAASSIASETGSIYGDNPDAPGTAIVAGTAAGILDLIPEAYVLSRFFRPGEAINGAAATGAKAYLQRFASEAAKTVPLESSTEAAQTLIEIAASKYGRGEPPQFTDEDYQHALNAGIIGALGGAVMAPASAFSNPAARPSTMPRLTDRVVEGLPIPGIEAPGGAMEFGGDIPEQDLTGIDSLRGPLRTDVDRAFRGDEQRFAPGESDPYQLGAAEQQGIKIPKAVTKATEAADEAARAWEIGKASTPETGFGDEPIASREFPTFGEPAAPMVPEIEALPASGQITDAPLQNLIGRQVEYAGYRGELVRDEEGNFLVLPPTRPNSAPMWIEVAGTGKDPTMLASSARVTPLEPANMVPKPAPATAVPQVVGRPRSEASNVPLGDMFPSDLVPRSDVNPFIPNVAPQPAAPPASPVNPPAVPPVQTEAPAAAPMQQPDGADKIVEKTPDVKLSHEAQVALWKRQNKVQTGPRWKLGTLPGGAKDVLNDIEDHGGVRSRQEGDGGEYDDFPAVFTGAAKLLVRGKNKGGLAIDKMASALGFAHYRDLYDAVEKAKVARRKAISEDEAMTQEGRAIAKAGAQRDRFERAAIRNESRPKSQVGKPITTDEMQIDERFKVKREPMVVVDILENGDVVVEDGERFGTQTIPAGTTIYPDKRTYRRVARKEATFLDEADEAALETPTESGKLQYTIQRPQQFEGRTIPGYIQIERQANNGRGEPLTDAERAAAPAPPEWLPTGQYTEEQVLDAIAKGPPARPAAGELIAETSFRLGSEEQPAPTAPPIPEATTEMFGSEVRSTAPTALDRANAAARAGVAIALGPKVQTMPTGEQSDQRSGNGVPPAPPDSLPNVRRLRIFEQNRPAGEVVESILPENATAQPTVESQALSEHPIVAVEKAVGKAGKSDSNVAVIIIDNATGQAHQRGVYRGANNVLFVDMASRRRGSSTGQGSTVSLEADLLGGTEGRPAAKLFSERAPNGAPRYSVYGMAELTRAGGPKNWNLGAADLLSENVAIQGAAKAYWNEEARKRPASRQAMPSAKADLEVFPVEMASWRRENPSDEAGAQMLQRIREYAADKAKNYEAALTPAKLDAWIESLRAGIEAMASVERKQATLISADYTVAPGEAVDVMHSAIRALSDDGEIDLAAFEQAAGGAFDQASKTMGLVATPAGRKKIVAFAVESMNGPVTANRVLAVLHETAHVVTDGIPEPLRVAFQEAVREMPYTEANWLMNPRSLDIRLLANADPATLSPEQRAALERLTPQEVAAARRIDRTTLIEEQMAEHLAQLGWNHAEAKGAVQKFIRFAKEIWLRIAMAFQKTVKGADHTSPELARRYVENRFLQFIHRDSAYARDRINDLRNWLGIPATQRQLIPVFPAGADWDQRMQYIDPMTGEMINVDHSIYTAESQLAYLKAAIENAQRFVERNPLGGPDTPDARLTRRTAFTAPLSFTPTVQTNTVFAALNLESEIYRNIAAHPDVGPLLPPGDDFVAEWLKLSERATPGARRQDAEQWARDMKDPTTGQPVVHDPETTVDDLPAAEEPMQDREGNQTVRLLTEAQDKALQFTIAALSDTSTRQQRRINHETDRIADLERQQRRNPADFPDAAQRELDDLRESLPIRHKIADLLKRRRNELLSKFSPGDLVHVYPTAEYLTVPAPDATEEQIRANRKGVVPRDLKFTDKTTFTGHLAAMEAWLMVPENRLKGQIYGTISEQYRKLNQIPVDLHRANTAAVFRRAITGSFSDELRASGLPALQALSKKFYEVSKITNEHSADVKIAGGEWSKALANFAMSLSDQPNQSFKERVYDELMRIWNFIDVSERNKIGTGEEGNLFDRIEAALRSRTDADVRTPSQRAALRSFLMATIENERVIRGIYEANPGLKVRDEEMGTYRRLVSHGLVTGRRSVARHMSGLFMQMNPTWSDTRPFRQDDARSFFESVEDAFLDRAAFDARVAELFPPNVVRDFVDPIVNNNTQLFEVQDADGIVRRASLLRVRQAWVESGGSVTEFATRLHALEGGVAGQEARTVGSVMRSFLRMFEEIKADQDSKEGVQNLGIEVLPRQMMDARIANDWPAEWVSYATYNEGDNLQLLHQLARSAAFGPDAIAANSELSNTIRQAKLDLDELYYVYDEALRDGKSPREVERLMGEANYGIAKNALKIAANLDRVETAFRTMSAATNYLAGDFKLFNDAMGFAATMMVQNPRGAIINTADILGPLVSLKLSRPGLKAVGKAIQTLVADFGNGVMQAFGQHAAFNVDAAKRRRTAGQKDPDLYTSWKSKMSNQGPGQSLAAPSGYEAPLAKTKRLLTRFAVKGRDIIPNIGSPFQGTGDEQTLSPKLRWGLFPNFAMSTMNANIDAAYNVFADLASRGVERINRMPTADRAQYVRELELGIRDIAADEVGYYGGILLNDRAAFDSMRFALETKMAGEKSVGSFIAKAYRRFEAAQDGEPWAPISNSQFTDIINFANTEWTLQSNFASLPPWMQSGPLRPLFIFLTWPYNAMRRFGKTFTDPEGRLTWWGANSTVADGMKAFFLVAAPATIAGSFAIDWYDKYLLGKKQNIRDTTWLTAVPGVGPFADPAAFVERVGRYGSAGLATDILNQIVNFDTQRNLSLDNRIVAINAISGLINSLVTTPYHQGGNVTYASVVRPFFQSVGGGGVLQYLQVVNNALGLNNQDAAINSRINTGNYLRAAGRELNLPVRVSRGAAELPTRTTPYLQQMELAALVNNQELFREAYREAIQAARDDKKEDPAKYIAENFMERHPLKRIFRVSPTEAEYRKLLSTMDEYGAAQVRAAINSYNRYLTNFFGKNPYYGKVVRQRSGADALIRSADRINAPLAIGANSFMAIP
jgi:hypothetical protein